MGLKEMARRVLSESAGDAASGIRSRLPERRYINPNDISDLRKKMMLHNRQSGLTPMFDLELKGSLACAISGQPQKTYCIRLQAEVSQIIYDAGDVRPDIGFIPQGAEKVVSKESIYLAGGISQAQTTRFINLWNMGVSLDHFVNEVAKISPLQEGARDKLHAFREGKLKAAVFLAQRMETLQRRANASTAQASRPS